MKWSLFPYQEDAVARILVQMDKARRRFHEEGELSSFALTATTGAGKTVIASAVIEALFRGSSAYDHDPDPSAVVLWLTDDASLNNQTLHNMVKASDLDLAQLHTVDSEEFPPTLAAGNVYFLNIQKLYDSSVRYTERTDIRPYSLWDTLRTTITNPEVTLYLILDEAHKGMKQDSGRATTVKRVVNGGDDVPPVPIVWGISATTERFTAAMKAARARGRTGLPDAEVPIAEVQASGLLKDAILLDNPNEAGQFDTTMLRDAVRQLLAQSDRWKTYCDSQRIEPVLPLLVVQVENKPAKAELDRLVTVILQEWPDLSANGVANVFGEHMDLLLGGRKVRYVSPENVQDGTAIRVLLAKDAVTTGWDCPRAEVLFSMRGAQDRTYITQFIGRMVRTPLARRITSDELLNTVVCLLPKFRRATTLEIARKLSNAEYDNGGGGGDKGDDGSRRGPKVFRQPVKLAQNPSIDPAVFALMSSLPSEPKPNATARPIPRLFRMVAAVAGDGLLPNAHETSLRRICQMFDGLVAEHHDELTALKHEIQTAEISTFRVSLGVLEVHEEAKQLAVDTRTVDDAFGTASRTLTRVVANAYQLHRAAKVGDDLFEAKLEVAALGVLPIAAAELSALANEMVNDWLVQFDTAIKHLSDERRAEYDQIRLQSSTPLQRDTILPDTGLEDTLDPDFTPYPTRPLHLLCDENGEYPVVGTPNSWETQVLDVELGRGTCVGWYRNPSAATQSAIQVPYRVGDRWSTVQPDFLFFSRRADGTLCASIVDPHGDHLADAMDKLRGLAIFADRHDGAYLRVESLAKNAAGQMVRLDLTQPAVREAVATADRASDLFNGPLATKFL